MLAIAVCVDQEGRPNIKIVRFPVPTPFRPAIPTIKNGQLARGPSLVLTAISCYHHRGHAITVQSGGGNPRPEVVSRGK